MGTATLEPRDRRLHRKGQTDFCSSIGFHIFQEISITWLCMQEIPMKSTASSSTLLSLSMLLKAWLSEAGEHYLSFSTSEGLLLIHINLHPQEAVRLRSFHLNLLQNECKP